jgi:hypothetical protein
VKVPLAARGANQSTTAVGYLRPSEDTKSIAKQAKTEEPDWTK